MNTTYRQHRLFGLRGSSYVKRYKEIFEEDHANICDAYNEIYKKSGKFTARDLGKLCCQFNLPVKVMDEFLPEITGYRYPTGTWRKLQDAGYKASDILQGKSPDIYRRDK